MNSDPPRPTVYTPFFRRFTDERSRELSDTIVLYEEARVAHFASMWASSTVLESVIDMIVDDLAKYIDLPTVLSLSEPLQKCLREVLELETAIFAFPEIDWQTANLSLKELVDLRQFLRAKLHFLANSDRMLEILIREAGNLYGGIGASLAHIPRSEGGITFDVPLYTLLPDPRDTVDRIAGTLGKDGVRDSGLFEVLNKQMYENACRASNLVPYQEHKRPVTSPHESDLPIPELIVAYLGGTPFYALLYAPAPLVLEPRIRFSHHWIVSPPGTGKSTTLQYLISKDLQQVQRGEASVIVMESKRDLVKAIEGLRVFAPGGELEGRLVSIDIEDVEYPVALNLFDVGIEALDDYLPREREMLLNSALSLYAYIFDALLGAEMTARQSTLFNFTIQLLLQIPGATIDTLIDLMQKDGLKQFDQYLPKLDPDAQRFFALKFNAKEFDPTKSQVTDRLFAIKRIRTLARMFSAPRTMLDLYAEMGSGKVILINAPSSLLGQDGVEIVGRFFIAMILLAAEKRQLLPQSERLPTYVYIDECQTIIRRDDKIPVILDQARAMNVGLVMAHQRLDQLAPSVLNALYGSTAIKFAAKVNEPAAAALARSMGTNQEFLARQPEYAFAAYIRGSTESAVSVRMPLVDMNAMERMTADQRQAIRSEMRYRYSSQSLMDAPSARSDASGQREPSVRKRPPDAIDNVDTSPSRDW